MKKVIISRIWSKDNFNAFILMCYTHYKLDVFNPCTHKKTNTNYFFL